MQKPFQKVILYGKRHRDKTLASVFLNLKKHLEKNNIEVWIETETARLQGLTHCQTVKENKLSQKGELIIVIGGDGSLLRAAREATLQHLPVLGINRGRLGFLTDIAPDAFDDIDKILKGHYHEETRFLLKAEIKRGKKILHQQLALNDIVLLPGDVAHMIEFSIEIDKQFMCLQRADGLICATPTGSTAYALSGGGPILHPQLNAVALVPMFPHKLTSRPIVVYAESLIKITLSENNQTLPRLSCDGQTRLPLKPNDKIFIQKFEKSLRLIHPENYQYFSTLRSKLQWESKPY